MIIIPKHLARHLLPVGVGVLLAVPAALRAQPVPGAPAPQPMPAGQAQPQGQGPGQPATGAPAPTGYYHYDDLLRRGDRTDDDPVVIHTGPTPELHVVRRGDTLWDICWYYFSDPWQWPKIWSYNGQITNPHWIYPGDLVRLLPKGFLVAPPVDAGLEPDAQPTTQPTTPPTPVPPAPVEARIRQLAFVDQDVLDTSMVITGAVEDKELLAAGDEVFVTYPKDRVPTVGSRFSIYAEDTPVYGPKQGKLGSYVRVLGELEITTVKLDKHAQARIVASTGEIERGARVGPLQRVFKMVPPVANEVDLQRSIVARLTRTQLIGSGEIVFIDAGEADRVKVGNRFYVVRRGDALPPADRTDLVGQDDRDFPARALGRIIIIDVGKDISVGLVDRAVEEMGVGDIVIMRKELGVDDASRP